MKKILLTYKTKTGFTKKYADWINEKISCHMISFDKIKEVDINRYDIIIFGAGIHAGKIDGLNKFKREVLCTGKKNIIIFATGGAPFSDEIFSKIKINNFSANEIAKFKFFYFQSGLNYEGMGFFDKVIMYTYRKILGFKKNKSEIEEGTKNTILKTYDYSKSENIKPLITYVNELYM